MKILMVQLPKRGAAAIFNAAILTSYRESGCCISVSECICL